jgi:hypothetical protein
MSPVPRALRLLAIVLTSGSLAACGSQGLLPGLGAGQGVRLASREAPRAGRWLAVQFHSHSRHSDDGRLKVAEMRELARRQGLDALGMSDHDTKAHFKDPEFKSEPDLTLIHSYEWTSKEGHAGVHGTTDDAVVPWTESKENLFAHVQAARETVILHHPHFPLGAAWKGGWDERASAVEVWNSFYLYPTNVEQGDSPLLPADATELTFEHGIDRDRLQARPDPTGDSHGYAAQDLGERLANEKAIRWWNGLLVSGKRVPITAASDFHRWPQHLASPCTLVYAADNSEQAILEGLRAGRSQGVQTPRQMRIDLEIAADDGSRLAMVGDTVAADKPLKVRTTVTKAKGQYLTLHTKAGVLTRIQVPSDSWTLETPLPAQSGKADFVWGRLDRGGWVSVLTALTSPIYVN